MVRFQGKFRIYPNVKFDNADGSSTHTSYIVFNLISGAITKQNMRLIRSFFFTIENIFNPPSFFSSSCSQVFV